MSNLAWLLSRNTKGMTGATTASPAVKPSPNIKARTIVLIVLVILFVCLYYSITFDVIESSLVSSFSALWSASDGPETEVVAPDDSDPDESLNSEDMGAEYLMRGSASSSLGDESQPLDYNAAPRTWEGPYNDIDQETRYLLYSPSGGLSNQLIELAYALEIARVLNRTLYVPMIGRHSSGWRAYEALPYPDLFPSDRILDFDRLVEMVPCVPLNVSVENFATKWTERMGANRVRIVYHPHRVNWGKQDLLNAVGEEKRKLLYLRGAEMYHPWFNVETTLRAKKYVRFSVHLRRRAIAIVDRMFPDRKFNAMHVRLADYTERWGTFQERSRAITNKPLTERFGPNNERMSRDTPIYLASDEPNNGGFVEIKKMFKVVSASQLPKDLVDGYRDLFPKSRIRHDMMGVLEQLICAQANFFSGTSWSTFSEHIELIRSSKAKLFPELLAPSSKSGNSQLPPQGP